MNKTLYYQLKNKLEGARDNTTRYYDDPGMILYYLENLQEVTDEILITLAQHLLTPEEYQKETED